MKFGYFDDVNREYVITTRQKHRFPGSTTSAVMISSV